jgi:hypothetical protein
VQCLAHTIPFASHVIFNLEQVTSLLLYCFIAATLCKGYLRLLLSPCVAHLSRLAVILLEILTTCDLVTLTSRAAVGQPTVAQSALVNVSIDAGRHAFPLSQHSILTNSLF